MPGAMTLPVGTLANVAAVLLGGAIGLIVHDRMPKRMKTIVFQGLGLCTLVIGMSMALKMDNPLVVIFSVVLGGVTGEAMRLEDAFNRLADALKARVKSDNSLFTDGLVTAFLIFCIGPMTIMGALDEGLRSDPTLLYTKSMLDGFGSIALGATFGSGVLFSVIPLFIYQYGITLCAGAAQAVLTEAMITALTATGGVLILGIGANLLELARIRLSNLLPALVYAVVLTALLA